MRTSRFELTDDQRDFAAALEGLLAGAGTVEAARAWADGDHDPGLELWARLAELGVTIAGHRGHAGRGLCLAFEALGRHAVPGPWVESAAYLPVALGREVEGVATVAVPPHVPLALDADVADEVYVGTALVTEVGPMHSSVDRTRRLFEVRGLETGASAPSSTTGRRVRRGRAGRLRPAARRRRAGAGRQRRLREAAQAVRPGIGSYQAIKHALADVRIALDFARPLVFAAALGEISPSAAKVAAGDAAYLASRTGLQVHGAIGYTQSSTSSLWITKIRALVGAWGTPAPPRALLEELG